MLVARCRELVPTLEWLDPACRYVLSGTAVLEQDVLSIRGFWGSVTLEGTRSELRAASRLLDRFDGQGELGHVDDQLADVVRALVGAGLAFDARHAWTWFNEMSANPAPFYGLAEPLDAYRLPVWQHPSAPRVRPVSPPANPRGRTSVLHSPAQVDPVKSTDLAVGAARAAYALRPDDTRPLPSAGAMYPAHLWVIGSLSPSKTSTLHYVPEDDVPLASTPCEAAQVRAVFAGDPAIDAVIAAGAAIIAVLADPGQMVAKYGNRGWRYCLIEAGAVMVRAQDYALANEGRLRPFGGFRDEALTDLLKVPLLPLLTLIVTAR